MVPEMRRRFAGPLRAWGMFFAVASAFLAVVCLGMGLWYGAHPSGLDVDWYGIAAASAAGCAAGALLIGARYLLGVLRYRPRGHFSRKHAVPAGRLVRA